MGFIDITGIDELRVLHEEVKTRGFELALMSAHIPVIETFKSTGFIDELKPGHLIANRGQVIAFLFQRLDHAYCKNVCPYKLFLECHTVK